jgi:hypothetical protein
LFAIVVRVYAQVEHELDEARLHAHQSVADVFNIILVSY